MAIETASVHLEAPAPLALGRRLVWEDADLGARVWTTGSGQEEMDTHSKGKGQVEMGEEAYSLAAEKMRQRSK